MQDTEQERLDRELTIANTRKAQAEEKLAIAREQKALAAEKLAHTEILHIQMKFWSGLCITFAVGFYAIFGEELLELIRGLFR